MSLRFVEPSERSSAVFLPGWKSMFVEKKHIWGGGGLNLTSEFTCRREWTEMTDTIASGQREKERVP